MQTQPTIEFKSTYGLKQDHSFRSEQFLYIPLTWKLGVSRIEALKIRIATWQPKYKRDGQAIFYYDVTTMTEAKAVLDKYRDFDFKRLERKFDTLYDSHKVRLGNTGETQRWLKEVMPLLRYEFSL